MTLQVGQLQILRHTSLLQERFAAVERQASGTGRSQAVNHQMTMQQLSGLQENLNSGFGNILTRDARVSKLGVEHGSRSTTNLY